MMNVIKSSLKLIVKNGRRLLNIKIKEIFTNVTKKLIFNFDILYYLFE